jgi:hypothetical protein
MNGRELFRPYFSEPSFNNAVGAKEKDVKKLRVVLEARLTASIDRFPFSPEDTLELPVLRLPFGEGKVEIPGFPKTQKPEVVEKIMDNVIISKSKFTDEYSYGPRIGTRGGKIEGGQVRNYRIYTFPYTVDGFREYVVVKGMSILQSIGENGEVIQQKEFVEYFVRPRDNEMDIRLH